MRKEEFKQFVKQYPNLISYVKTGEMTWQKFYDMWDIYGEDISVWNGYINQKEEKKLGDSINFGTIVESLKKVDLNIVQKNIVGIQKALGLVQDLVSKDGTEKNTYEPRPLYRKFED